MIARGPPTREIADELGVTVHSASHQVSEVLAFMKRRAWSDSGEAVHLSSREVQVVELVRRGSMDKAIAASIGISVTADDHVYRILRKFGLHRRRELAQLRVAAEKPPTSGPT